MKTKNKLISVVVLVGGSGSRFSSINEFPKQLSKLNNEFILMHIINNFRKYGLKHFIFPLGLKKNFFEKFFHSKKNIYKYKFNILKKNFSTKDLKSNKINISIFLPLKVFYYLKIYLNVMKHKKILPMIFTKHIKILI